MAESVVMLGKIEAAENATIRKRAQHRRHRPIEQYHRFVKIGVGERGTHSGQARQRADELRGARV